MEVSQITDYKCPNCGGALRFDGESGKVVCDYCDNSYSVEEVEELYRAMNEQAESAAHKSAHWDVEHAGGDWGADGERMRTYVCPSCGAALDCDETTAATECPYCGNATIIPSQMSGTRKPDYILPFKVSRAQAIEALRRHYKGKRLLPKLFSQDNRVEKIQGVYVPFWLYSGSVEASYTLTGERIHTHRTAREEITDITTYRLLRGGTMSIETLPVDASAKMDDALMDSLEPFDMSELKEFSLSYLPGYLADHFDVDADTCGERADVRVTNTADAAFRATAGGYSGVTIVSKSVHILPDVARCALLPVWVLTTCWNGKTYTFAMNGQTGKMVGDLPVDKGLARKWHLLYAAAISVILYALNWLPALL